MQGLVGCAIHSWTATISSWAIAVRFVPSLARSGFFGLIIPNENPAGFSPAGITGCLVPGRNGFPCTSLSFGFRRHLPGGGGIVFRLFLRAMPNSKNPPSATLLATYGGEGVVVALAGAIGASEAVGGEYKVASNSLVSVSTEGGTVATGR